MAIGMTSNRVYTGTAQSADYGSACKPRVDRTICELRLPGLGMTREATQIM